MVTSILSPTQVISTTILVYAIYYVGLVIYRLFFHPLVKFPGPRYAAISTWHEFYYDVVKQGQFSFIIEEWHKQYGPIIRVTPNEIHIQDSQFYDTIYTKAGRVDKYGILENRFSTPRSAFNTCSADVHAVRRGAMNNLFSRARIVRLESVVREKVNALMEQIRQYKDTGTPFKLSSGFMALSGDVIMRYCFGMDHDHINSKDFEINLHDGFMAASQKSALSVHFPIVPWIMECFPDHMLEKMEPSFASLFRVRRDLGRQVEALKNKQEIDLDKSITTVIQTLIDDPILPEADKGSVRLNDEAQVLVGAGVTTTGWALSVGSFHILNNSEVHGKLRKELYDAIPNPERMPTWTELEKLPYLSGCVREAVRLSYPVTARNPRLLPRPVTYGDWVIPARTPISMTITDVSNDENIFPEHQKFNPERWIGRPKTKDGSELDRFFVCFQKGTRSCLGINLAFCEIYLAIATIFRNFDLELYNTDESDVKLAHDFFIPSPKLDSEGIRVRFVDKD